MRMAAAHRLRMMAEVQAEDVPATRFMMAAGFARGPVQVLDFILPLWAGAALGMSAGEVGALVAMGSLLSLAARPFVGVIADRFDRARTAAVGVIILALSFAMYAIAHGLAVALAAAAVEGVGGATFWVALRARVGERIGTEPEIFARLLAAEVTGAWIAFAVGLTIANNGGFRSIFVLSAIACLVAAALLLRSEPQRPAPAAVSRPDLHQLANRMRPLLIVIAVTATAEFGVELLLLLHLQRHFDLTVGEIALVYLPGFIMFTIVPTRIQPLVRRIGNGPTLAASLSASALVAVGLSFAAQPVVVAILWALSAVCLAAAIPVEQTIVAEVSEGSLGRGMSLYQSATLVGAVLGPILAGALYEVGWRSACVGAAAVLVIGAAILPLALRRLRLPVEPDTGSASAANE